MLSIFDKILGALNIKVKNKKHFIKAGGNISAGGDIFVGKKSVSKTKITPNVHISPLTQRDRIYAELYNNGDEDISELSVLIYWSQEGSPQSREIYQFFNDNEDPVLAHSHKCSYLRQGDKKIIAGLPLFSDDGKIKFIANAAGAKSGKKIEKNFYLDNKKYSQR